jgi:hypothetical protein
MKSESTVWNGVEVKYRPGKIYVCAKLGMHRDICENLIMSICPLAFIRNFYAPGIFEISVDPALTLKIASDMIASSKFRFIELEREKYF